MSHRGRRARRSEGWSVRVRALLALGAVGLVGVTGTWAYWTDDVAITGTTFTSGVLDLQVNDGNSYVTTTLGMNGMVPGSTSAEVLRVKNNGTVPLKYTLVGGLGGTDAVALDTARALLLTISTGSRTGAGLAATCTGGSPVYGPTALTSATTTPIIGVRRGPLAAGGGFEDLCFQVSFDTGAASTLQGKTATATFTFTGSSDVS